MPQVNGFCTFLTLIPKIVITSIRREKELITLLIISAVILYLLIGYGMATVVDVHAEPGVINWGDKVTGVFFWPFILLIFGVIGVCVKLFGD
jgi:hypothetical protein